MAEYGKNVFFVEYCRVCRTVVDGRRYNEEREECIECHSHSGVEREACRCSWCLSVISVDYFGSPKGNG